MSKSVRNAIGLLVLVFMISMVVGAAGMLASKSGNATAGTAVPFKGPEKETPTPKPVVKKVTRGLTAEAVHEGAGRIVISGTQKPADAGTRVTVQRKESGEWADFPAGSTIDADGSYSLWLKTGRKGDMTFRVVDSETGEASNPVKVKV